MQDSQCSGAAFDVAFYWNEEVQSRQAIYEAIYGREMHFLHRSLFQRNNEHLKETVLPGEIVIISNMPRTDATDIVWKPSGNRRGSQVKAFNSCHPPKP